MPQTPRTIEPPFTDVPGALNEIRAGRMLVVVDDCPFGSYPVGEFDRPSRNRFSSGY